MVSSRNDDIITLLVLGDGDFSFSLDWARYLASNSTTNTTNKSCYPHKSLHLIATGLDSKDALLYKYKDANFLLKALQDLDQKPRKSHQEEDKSTAAAAAAAAAAANSDNNTNRNGSGPPILRVSIYHDINAIICQCQEEAQPQPLSLSSSSRINFYQKAHHVVFHHPHLGTEDAVMHSQFLCHLFHSVTTYWLRGRGTADATAAAAADDDDTKKGSFHCCCYFHLTLVKGQFERWKCDHAAKRHGMIMVDRRTFTPPHLNDSDESYYQHRRHQTGRSFAARAPEGSETYTFVRMNDCSTTDKEHEQEQVSGLVTSILGNIGDAVDSNGTITPKDNNGVSKSHKNMFLCPHCHKSFSEERSRKSHIKAVHADNLEFGCKKRKRNNDDVVGAPMFPCILCHSKDNDNGSTRLFASAQALKDHQTAKHFAEHEEIKPDWYKHSHFVTSGQTARDDSSGSADDFGSCDICGLKYSNTESRQSHKFAFVPFDVRSSLNTTAGAAPDLVQVLPFQCCYCEKLFREDRARKQHENFCKAKT